VSTPDPGQQDGHANGWSYLANQIIRLATFLNATRLTTSPRNAPDNVRDALQQLATEITAWPKGNAPMSDRHRFPPLTFRPPADIREWLANLAETTGQPVGTIIVDALQEYKENHDVKPCPECGSLLAYSHAPECSKGRAMA
jgi:hypothetical protein